MAENQRSQFLATLKKNAADLAKSAKKPPNSGYLEDSEVLEKLGIEDTDTKVVLQTKLVRINYGTDKNKNPYFSFRYSVSQGEHRGLPLDEFFGFDKSNKQRYEINTDRLMGTLQTLGYNTPSWTKANVDSKTLEACEELTEKKPGVSLTVSAFERTDGSLGLRLSVLSTFEADPDPKQDRKAPEPEEADEEPYEDAEAEEAEEAEEVEEAETDWAEWVGYAVQFDAGDGAEEVSITKWDAKEGVFTVETENEELYEVEPSDLSFPDDEE